MVYKCEPNPSLELFEVLMDTAFNHGNEKMVRYFYELCVDEFKLQPNATIIMYKLNAQGKGATLSALDTNINS